MQATIQQFRETATRVSRAEAKGTDQEEIFEMDDVTNDIMFYGPNGGWGRIEIVRVLFPDSKRLNGGKERGCYGTELFMLELENSSYIGDRYEMEQKLYDWMGPEGALEICETWHDQKAKINVLADGIAVRMYKELAEEFPDIKSGDVPFDKECHLLSALKEAMGDWIHNNVEDNE